MFEKYIANTSNTHTMIILRFILGKNYELNDILPKLTLLHNQARK